MVKIVYVAHEVGGDVEGNIKKILEICRTLHTKDVIPFAPYLLALQYLDDASPEERLLGTSANAAFFERGIIDEVGVFGTRVSKGIFGELELALQLGIPVKAYDAHVELDVAYAIKGLERGIHVMPYIMAERKLPDGNTLFFRQDPEGGRPADMVIFDSETYIDQITGRDVTRFVPTISSWDEVFDGWPMLDEHVAKFPEHRQPNIRSAVLDLMAKAYTERRPLDSFLRNTIATVN